MMNRLGGFRHHHHRYFLARSDVLYLNTYIIRYITSNVIDDVV